MKPDERTLRDLYEVQRLGSHVLATRLGVTPTTIVRWLREAGIPVRPNLSLEEKRALKPAEAVLRDLYEAQRLSAREVGERLGVSHTSVKRWIKEYGIKMRPKWNGLANRGVEPPTRDELYQWLHVEHIGFRGVAEKYGVDYTAVARWAKKNGIKPPTIWQTRTKGRQPILDPDEVWSLYEAGYSMEQIGAMFGVSQGVVSLIFEKHGFEARPAGLTGLSYVCSNGLQVRSSYEIRVAEWLVERDVPFTYEPGYPFNSKLKADFLANGWYVEIWGIKDLPGYEEKKRRKVRLCELHGIPLVQLRYVHFQARGAHVFEERLSKVLSPAPAIGSQGMLF